MKLRSIQLLRAVAVILVVYAHSIDLQMRFGHSFQEDFFYLKNFGAFGVDLFFVVSGFVISLVAEKYSGAKQGFRFLARRFIRLNPVYYLVSALVFLLFFQEAPTIKNIVLHGGVLRKSLLLLPLFDKIYWVHPLLAIGWTLSFEWLFYIQFFIAILFTPRKKEWLIASLIVGMVALGIFHRSEDPRWIFLTSPIQLEFLLGIIIYRLYSRLDSSSLQAAQIRLLAWTCLVAGTAICLYLVFTGFGEDLEMLDLVNGKSIGSRLLHWATASALLVAGATFMEKGDPQKSDHRLALGWSWLVLCGDASYSIDRKSVV